MPPAVRLLEDPLTVLEAAGPFLAADPIRHNLILTLLDGRARHADPGRYWLVEEDARVVGVVFQSPLHFPATLTPMPAAAARAAAGFLAASGVALPGVSGAAGTAACFAGQWAEATGAPARPVEGQRLYELGDLRLDRPPSGSLRPAGPDDADLLTGWMEAFRAEAGGIGEDGRALVDRRTAAGELWVWEDAGPVAFTGLSAPLAGAVRVGPVYTPPECRRRGYASGLVAGVSGAAVERGLRCLLYTDLANPTSNAVYRALGYRPVEEMLRYAFGEVRTSPAGNQVGTT